MAEGEAAADSVWAPVCLSERFVIDKNPLRQVLVRSQFSPLVRVESRTYAALEDGRRVRISGRTPALGQGEIALLVAPDKLREARATNAVLPGRWVGDLTPSTPEQVVATLAGALAFREEDRAAGRRGLRTPQLGAVHSVLGYWMTNVLEPATVVMPAGTGKTETMLALFATGRIARLLVIVPSDALRGQISGKFETFGILQPSGVVAPTALRPLIGQVLHGFTAAENAEAFARRCNVVVTTPQALNASPAPIRAALLACFSHLFVDEAHHVVATTWRQVRDEFDGKPVVQFTATPFREDGQHLGGRLVFTYPLRAAQQAGYFSSIDFISMLDLGDHDRAIATRAVRRLRDDLAAGRDHLLMARVGRIGRADGVLPIYRELAPDLAPVVLHSNDAKERRDAALEAIRSRESRIIVCVNMLGEGFDLPALKVAAIHDPHKSLGVTLQFVGRFARPGEAIGDACVVVGRPSGEVDPSLRRLYAEDSDWNAVVRDLSEHAVGDAEEVSEFEAAFGSQPDGVPMRSLLPKMSTVVYRTAAEWNPHGVLEVFPEEQLLTFPIAINERDRVAWFVTEHRTPVTWGGTKDRGGGRPPSVYRLLGRRRRTALHQQLQQQVAPRRARRRRRRNRGHQDHGRARVPDHGRHRAAGPHQRRPARHPQSEPPLLVPRRRGRLRRLSRGRGPDQDEDQHLCLRVRGWRPGEHRRLSQGADLEHRIATTLKHWVDWCNRIGAKVTDEGISVDEVMRHFIRPQVVEERPPLVPLGLEWPWDLLASSSEELRVEHAGQAFHLIDVDFHVTQHGTTGPIPFSAVAPGWSLDYELTFGAGQMRFAPVAADAEIVSRDKRIALSEALNETGLIVHFEQDALVVPPAMLLRPERDLGPFDPAELVALDWAGVDLTVESQGPTRRADSIQARMVRHIEALADWDLIVDDDGAGEVADIVAIRVDDRTFFVHLVHCKWVHGGEPRAQVGDLYEVCGQAQKSAQWRRNVPAMLQRLIRREKKRIERARVSGILKGDAQALYRLIDVARLRQSAFTISIAQPGLSRQNATAAQLELLAATQVYVQETAHAAFQAYCSP